MLVRFYIKQIHKVNPSFQVIRKKLCTCRHIATAVISLLSALPLVWARQAMYPFADRFMYRQRLITKG